MHSTKKCLICQRPNDTLYWHNDPDTGDIWCWCQGRCQRGYSIYEYCAHAGLSIIEFLQSDFDFEEAKPNEITRMEWPKNYLPLYDERSSPGIAYIKSRGLDVDDGMFYDYVRNGIVFPYYYDNVFCGAQTRFLEPFIDKDGELRKIDTMYGTRLGLLFYGWNQSRMLPNIRAIIVTEGAVNAISLQQALNKMYGGVIKNPFKAVACSGSGATIHHIEALKELKEAGFKVIAAPDSDEPGIKMLKKLSDSGAITQYSLTNDSDTDWNDVLKQGGKEELVKMFLLGVKNV